MATASAAAMPDSPDITMPSSPSGLSSNRPVPSPIIFKNEVTESPGSAARWVMPVRIGVVIFIALSRARGDKITGAIDTWSRHRRLWFKPGGLIVRAGGGRYSVGRAQWGGFHNVGSNG